MSCGFSVTFHAVSCYSKYEASLEYLIPKSLRQLYVVCICQYILEIYLNQLCRYSYCHVFFPQQQPKYSHNYLYLCFHMVAGCRYCVQWTAGVV